MSLPDDLSYIWLPEEQGTDILYQLEYKQDNCLYGVLEWERQKKTSGNSYFLPKYSQHLYLP